MKVLIVVPSYWPAIQFGGPILSVHLLCKNLARQGCEVTVYTTNKGIEGKVSTNEEVFKDGVCIRYFEYSRWFEFMGEVGWQFSWQMTNALRNNITSFQVVYIVGVWSYPVSIAAYYCRKYKTPYVISPRGMLYPETVGKKSWKKRPYYMLVSKRNMVNASTLHFTSLDEATKCISMTNPENNYFIVPNGIKIEDYETLPTKEEFLSNYPYLTGKKIILFLGRINWKKGLDLLIDAYAHLCNERDDIHLVIAGDDSEDYAREIKQVIKSSGLSYYDGNSSSRSDPNSEITFTGLLDHENKMMALSGSDLFILPSYSENFGMAVIEAMLCKVPVIVSHNVGIRDDIKECNAGVVVENDVESICNAMRTLLDDEYYCNNLSLNAYELVKNRYSIENIGKEMMSHLNSVSIEI